MMWFLPPPIFKIASVRSCYQKKNSDQKKKLVTKKKN
jgi:hypothetical protein